MRPYSGLILTLKPNTLIYFNFIMENRKIKTASEDLPLKERVRMVLKTSDFGNVKGARIKVTESEDGYIRGLVNSPMFTGVDVASRQVAIRNSLKGKFNKTDRRRILTILTAAPADFSD